MVLKKRRWISSGTVIIATPDHSHGVIGMACIRAGKHVYIQKPLAHSVNEARKVCASTKLSRRWAIRGTPARATRFETGMESWGRLDYSRRKCRWSSLRYSWLQPRLRFRLLLESAQVVDEIDEFIRCHQSVETWIHEGLLELILRRDGGF